MKKTSTIVRLAAPGWQEWLRLLELRADLAPGTETVAAYVLDSDGDRIDRDSPNEDYRIVIAEDPMGTVRGKGADDSSDLRGTICVARKVGDNYQIIAAQGWPTMVSGTLTADLAETDADFQITGVSVMQPIGAIDIEHLLDESARLTVTNEFTHAGSRDGRVVAVWDEATAAFSGLQVACP